MVAILDGVQVNWIYILEWGLPNDYSYFYKGGFNDILLKYALFPKAAKFKNDTIGEKKMESYYYIFQIAPKYALTVKNE